MAVLCHTIGEHVPPIESFSFVERESYSIKVVIRLFISEGE